MACWRYYAVLICLFCVIRHINGQDTTTEGPTTTQEPPVTWFECPDQYSYHPHPENCTQYLICVFGKPYLRACAGGLNWNDMLKICDWPNPRTTCQQIDENTAYRPMNSPTVTDAPAESPSETQTSNPYGGLDSSGLQNFKPDEDAAKTQLTQFAGKKVVYFENMPGQELQDDPSSGNYKLQSQASQFAQTDDSQQDQGNSGANQASRSQKSFAQDNHETLLPFGQIDSNGQPHNLPGKPLGMSSWDTSNDDNPLQMPPSKPRTVQSFEDQASNMAPRKAISPLKGNAPKPPAEAPRGNPPPWINMALARKRNPNAPSLMSPRPPPPPPPQLDPSDAAPGSDSDPQQPSQYQPSNPPDTSRAEPPPPPRPQSSPKKPLPRGPPMQMRPTFRPVPQRPTPPPPQQSGFDSGQSQDDGPREPQRGDESGNDNIGHRPVGSPPPGAVRLSSVQSRYNVSPPKQQGPPTQQGPRPQTYELPSDGDESQNARPMISPMNSGSPSYKSGRPSGPAPQRPPMSPNRSPNPRDRSPPPETPQQDDHKQQNEDSQRFGPVQQRPSGNSRSRPSPPQFPPQPQRDSDDNSQPSGNMNGPSSQQFGMIRSRPAQSGYDQLQSRSPPSTEVDQDPEAGSSQSGRFGVGLSNPGLLPQRSQSPSDRSQERSNSMKPHFPGQRPVFSAKPPRAFNSDSSRRFPLASVNTDQEQDDHSSSNSFPRTSLTSGDFGENRAAPSSLAVPNAQFLFSSDDKNGQNQEGNFGSQSANSDGSSDDPIPQPTRLKPSSNPFPDSWTSQRNHDPPSRRRPSPSPSPDQFGTGNRSVQDQINQLRHDAFPSFEDPNRESSDSGLNEDSPKNWMGFGDGQPSQSPMMPDGSDQQSSFGPDSSGSFSPQQQRRILESHRNLPRDMTPISGDTHDENDQPAASQVDYQRFYVGI